MPIYEPLFTDNSYGYRPGRSGKGAMKRVKEYAEQGYTHAVALDLSKYFDTLNHEKVLNLLRKGVKGERVIQWIKRYLKSGVMENGVVMKTEEGSPQGGNISLLLANIYLNEFDQEYEKRGVKYVRYADDIVLLAKSDRAAKRLLETSTEYLEGTLKLKVNQEKSRVVSVFAIRNFKFLGFTLGKNEKGIYIRVHGKTWKKMKTKLKELSSRRSCHFIEAVTSVGPMSAERVYLLKKSCEKCNSGLIFVTAFSTMKKCKEKIMDIAWDTEIWVAETPDHMIHLNGDRFIGPRD